MPPATPDQNIHARIVEVLVEARHAAGLRQVDLAKRLGRAQSFVSKYETHKRSSCLPSRNSTTQYDIRATIRQPNSYAMSMCCARTANPITIPCGAGRRA